MNQYNVYQQLPPIAGPKDAHGNRMHVIYMRNPEMLGFSGNYVRSPRGVKGLGDILYGRTVLPFSDSRKTPRCA